MPFAWRLRILGLGIALAAGMIPIAAFAGTDFIGGTCSAILSPACLGAIAADSFVAGPGVDSIAGGQTLAASRDWSWSIGSGQNVDAATISVQSTLNLADPTQFVFTATDGPFPGTPVSCTVATSNATCIDPNQIGPKTGGLLVDTSGQRSGGPGVGVPIHGQPGFDSSRRVSASGVTALVTITDATRFAPGATRIRIRLDAGLLTVTDAGTGTALPPCSSDAAWVPGPACTDGPSTGEVNILRAQPAPTTYQISGPGDPSANVVAPELDVSVISYTCGSASCQPPYSTTASSLTYTDPQLQGSVTFSANQASTFALDQEQASVVQFPGVPKTTQWTAYVPTEGSNSVTPINVGTNTPGTAIPGVTRPVGIAITPDGSTAYVANTTANTVTPINLATNTTGKPIAVGTNPLEIAITPNGTTAYVVNNTSNDVTPINLASNTAGLPIPVGTNPSAIAITPNGATAYVANTTSNTVTPINLGSNIVGAAIAVGASPQWISITPDGSTAYVADGASNDITPINLANNTVEPAIPIGGDPAAIAITPDGSTAYVSQFYAFTVTPINLATRTLGTAIPITGTTLDQYQAGPYPTGLAITPDGRTVYVTDDGSSAVSPIDVATNTVGTAIPVGANPARIAITPDQAPVAALSVTVASAGSPSSFDASASTVALGSIVRYDWNFGDGSITTTPTPTTTHTYAAGGSFTASVTETDSAGTSTFQVFTGQTMLKNGGPSASISKSLVIPLVSTTTSLGASPTSISHGQSVTLTATVSPSSASGTVKFQVGGVPISSCSTQPLSAGTTTCVTSSLAVGSDSVTAVYSGDSVYATSTSTAVVVTVTPPAALVISPSSLPAATAKAAYSVTLSATGGTLPDSWSVISGTLPKGLSLSGTTGVLSGTPTKAGTSNFTVQVTDTSSPVLSATKVYSIAVQVAISPASLPDGTATKAYSTKLSAAGGIAPYSWSLVTGVLPAGLSLSTSTGVISGTPSAAGTSSFTVRVSDSSSPALIATMSYSIVVQLAISPAALPAATVGNAYAATLSAIGGTSSYTWSLASGTLPAGLSLSASTGVISGTPSAAGTSGFTIQVTDSSSPALSGSKTYSMVVKLALSPGPLPTGTANTAYSTTLSATGGTAPYSWALVSGTLPTGLSLSASTGVISGTPTKAGTSTFTVQASDASSPTLSANKTYSIVVKLAISPTSLPAAKVNTAYSVTLLAGGGTSPYTWKLASGALPKGLSLSASTGMISGTPTKAGTSTFIVRVTDSSSPALSTTGSYSLTVSP